MHRVLGKYSGVALGKKSFHLFNPRKNKAKIIVCRLDFQTTMTLAIYLHAADMRDEEHSGKVWIATTLPDRSVRVFYRWVDLEDKHVLLSFLTQAKKRTSHYDFRLYFTSVVEYGATPFQCSHSSTALSKKVWKRCVERESWNIPPKEVVAEFLSEDAYSIPTAIQVVLRVLGAASSSQLSRRKIGDGLTSQIVQPWQVRFLLSSSLVPPFNFLSSLRGMAGMGRSLHKTEPIVYTIQ